MKALVDTTVFADALLKAQPERKAAKVALARYRETLGPVYAFKELKAGALKNFVWFHNKLALLSYDDALRALHRSALTPRRYQTATALEALIAASDSASAPPEDWARKYGLKAADHKAAYKDRLRLTLKRIIKQGWNSRRKLTTQVIAELACYPETPITDVRDLTLECEPLKCDVKAGCELARLMQTDTASILQLITAVEAAPPKPENARRAKALKKLLKDGWKSFSNQDCRDLGDAVFAFLAPTDARVLTTNMRDIQPLAQALGKDADPV